jgi:signal transduction histidine kinase
LNKGLSREHQGTGMGLPLVQKLVELMGGTIHVESISGQGSRFIITLPWETES